MAKSKLQKKIFNMAYGIGASIVLVGALAKITHMTILGMGGDLLLTIGLVTEAIIFFVSAFEPVDDELDWSKVYPELTGGEPIGGGKKAQGVKAVDEKEASGLLSKKLDEMLKDARIDAGLMDSLASSIRSFEGAAKGIAPTTDAMASTKKYSEEMVKAAAQLESLNGLYQVQLESTKKQTEVNKWKA